MITNNISQRLSSLSIRPTSADTEMHPIGMAAGAGGTPTVLRTPLSTPQDVEMAAPPRTPTTPPAFDAPAEEAKGVYPSAAHPEACLGPSHEKASQFLTAYGMYLNRTDPTLEQPHINALSLSELYALLNILDSFPDKEHPLYTSVKALFDAHIMGVQDIDPKDALAAVMLGKRCSCVFLQGLGTHFIYLAALENPGSLACMPADFPQDILERLTSAHRFACSGGSIGYDTRPISILLDRIETKSEEEQKRTYERCVVQLLRDGQTGLAAHFFYSIPHFSKEPFHHIRPHSLEGGLTTQDACRIMAFLETLGIDTVQDTYKIPWMCIATLLQLREEGGTNAAIAYLQKFPLEEASKKAVFLVRLHLHDVHIWKSGPLVAFCEVAAPLIRKEDVEEVYLNAFFRRIMERGEDAFVIFHILRGTAWDIFQESFLAYRKKLLLEHLNIHHRTNPNFIHCIAAHDIDFSFLDKEDTPEQKYICISTSINRRHLFSASSLEFMLSRCPRENSEELKAIRAQWMFDWIGETAQHFPSYENVKFLRLFTNHSNDYLRRTFNYEAGEDHLALHALSLLLLSADPEAASLPEFTEAVRILVEGGTPKSAFILSNGRTLWGIALEDLRSPRLSAYLKARFDAFPNNT
jgi:hypothetical protein